MWITELTIHSADETSGIIRIGQHRELLMENSMKSHFQVKIDQLNHGIEANQFMVAKNLKEKQFPKAIRSTSFR